MEKFGRKINESFNKYLEKMGATTLTEAVNNKKIVEGLDYQQDLNLAIYNAIGDVCWEFLSQKDHEPTIEELESALDFFIKKWKEGYGDLEESYLNEAVPRDLIPHVKRSRNNYRRDYDNRLDYQSADMKEITVDDVMQMKKNGEPLDDIYILKNGNMIALTGGRVDRDRSHLGYGSGVRKNQSLKKSLEDADKIYIGKIQPFSETNPEEFETRKSQFKTRRHMDYARDENRYAKDVNRYADEMIRGEHDDDFWKTPDDEDRLYRAGIEKSRAQGRRNRSAKDRYFDSNATNRVPKFKDLKDDERYYNRVSKRDAERIKELKARKKQSDAVVKQSRDEINKMLRK